MGVAVALLLWSVALALHGGNARRAEAEVRRAPPGYVEQLRYIGRDPLTGMATTVNDRYIAEVERAIENHGAEESIAIPPPPVSGADIEALVIPAINVGATVGRYGVDRAGRLDVPQDDRTVGWNPGYASLPGSGQSTFLAAHFEYLGRPGVFYRLSSLSAGDEVRVMLTDGSEHRYRVTSTVDYALATIDMASLLVGREGVESIVLMTCSGPPDEGNYPLRTVVLAERVR